MKTAEKAKATSRVKTANGRKVKPRGRPRKKEADMKSETILTKCTKEFKEQFYKLVEERQRTVSELSKEILENWMKAQAKQTSMFE